jgi:carbon-monoxide dehydrogenase large subunit
MSVATGYVGRPIPRVEDMPLLTGRGRYVSDVRFDGEWVMAVVRSTYAHARIVAVDTREARSLAGVHAVITVQDLPDLARPLADGSQVPVRALAADVVRYVGEPVAVVLAENRYVAEDAAERVNVSYDPLEAVADVEAALADRVILHPALGTNVVDHVHFARGDGAEALERADVVVSATLRMGRVSAQPMEPRGVVATYDAGTDQLTVYHSTQAVHRARDRIAAYLGVPPERVRVVTPDVGGGFGVKNGAYAEEALVAYLARHFRRPVRWAGDRFEEFLATYQEREQVHHVRLGVTRDGDIVALVDRFYQDNGAYAAGGPVVARTTARNLVGPYRIPHFAIDGFTVLTNKVPVAPYRGAGRPQGHFVIERMLDRAADLLGMDRAAIRARNLVRPEELPYDAGVPDVVYDSGDFPRALADLLTHIDYDGFRRRQAELRRQGRRIGLGLACYVEISGGFGFEGAHLTLMADGRIEVATGAASQGQGHRTALAQVAADRLLRPLDAVVVVEGDTARIARGFGTFGSRTMIMAGSATSAAAEELAERARRTAAERLEAAVEDVELTPEGFAVRGVPGRTCSWTELARWLAERGVPPLTAEAYFSADVPTFGFGAHALEVSVDPATARVTLERYVILHDGGTVVNPLLSDGQVIGGAVQGLGSALTEEMVYGPDGQPLTTTFLDYVLPGATEMPDIEILHRNYPAPTNPRGFKGVGEAGIIPSQAVVLAAVEDAFRDRGLKLDMAPVTPKRLFEALAALEEVPA